MTGKIDAGLSAGGKAYGYRPIKRLNEHGELIRGELEIVPEEAAIVRRIYEEYAKGISPKAICHKLNSEFVKPPRGKWWSPSSLHGKNDRGSGILRNPIYVGKTVWNKVRMIKDPDTGKRVSRPNPQSESNEARAVYLNVRLQRELANWKSCLRQVFCDDPVISSQKRSKRYQNALGHFSANSLCQLFARIYRAAGIDGASSHSGRRWFITKLAHSGVSPKVIMTLAGHKNLTTTQRYIDVNDEMLAKAVERL